jgi:hypothetical protein
MADLRTCGTGAMPGTLEFPEMIDGDMLGKFWALRKVSFRVTRRQPLEHSLVSSLVATTVESYEIGL